MTVKTAVPPTNGQGTVKIHAPKKLDVACGQNKQVGFKGIDIAGDADIIHDLNEIPWPIKSNSVEQVFCAHYVEHIDHWRPGWERDGWWRFFDELYRVMKDGATAEIIHPYVRSDRAFWDPTHVRFIHEVTWHYLNPEWRAGNNLDHYPVECNFEVVTLSMMGLPDDYLARNVENQNFQRAHYWNVVNDLGVLLEGAEVSDTCYLVQEIDGTSRFTLEDGSGFLLLEFCPPPEPGGEILMGDRRPHHEVIRRREPIDDDVEAFIASILSEF